MQTASNQFGPGYSTWLIVSLGANTSLASAAWFGVGCGAGGPTPGLVMSGPPYFGWNRTLAYVNGPAFGSGFVFLGAVGPGASLGAGCNAYLDLTQPSRSSGRPRSMLPAPTRRSSPCL